MMYAWVHPARDFGVSPECFRFSEKFVDIYQFLLILQRLLYAVILAIWKREMSVIAEKEKGMIRFDLIFLRINHTINHTIIL